MPSWPFLAQLVFFHAFFIQWGSLSAANPVAMVPDLGTENATFLVQISPLRVTLVTVTTRLQ